MSYSDADHDNRPWCPPVDVYRAEGHYVVKADLPGMQKPDISVRAKNNTLYISGTRGFTDEEEAEEHLRLERLHGKFVCEVHLPGMNSEGMLDIGYEGGVLSVEVPIK